MILVSPLTLRIFFDVGIKVLFREKSSKNEKLVDTFLSTIINVLKYKYFKIFFISNIFINSSLGSQIWISKCKNY